MTKASKARMIAYFVEMLEYYDKMILLNNHNETAKEQFLEDYKKMAKQLAELRDTPTSD